MGANVKQSYDLLRRSFLSYQDVSISEITRRCVKGIFSRWVHCPHNRSLWSLTNLVDRLNTTIGHSQKYWKSFKLIKIWLVDREALLSIQNSVWLNCWYPIIAHYPSTSIYDDNDTGITFESVQKKKKKTSESVSCRICLTQLRQSTLANWIYVSNTIYNNGRFYYWLFYSRNIRYIFYQL